MPYYPPTVRTVPRLRASQWYNFPPGAGATSLLVLGECRYTWFYLAETTTFTQIGVDVSTVGAATSLVRLGIYNDGGGFPGTLWQDFGTAASATLNVVAGPTVTFTLPAGVWWGAVAGQGSGTMPTIRTSSGHFYGVNLGTTGAGSNVVTLTQASVTGALPATATPVNSASTAPAFRLKTAA